MRLRSLKFFVGAIELWALEVSGGAMEEMIRGVLRDVYPWPPVIS